MIRFLYTYYYLYYVHLLVLVLELLLLHTPTHFPMLTSFFPSFDYCFFRLLGPMIGSAFPSSSLLSELPVLDPPMLLLKVLLSTAHSLVQTLLSWANVSLVCFMLWTILANGNRLCYCTAAKPAAQN